MTDNATTMTQSSHQIAQTMIDNAGIVPTDNQREVWYHGFDMQFQANGHDDAVNWLNAELASYTR